MREEELANPDSAAILSKPRSPIVTFASEVSVVCFSEDETEIVRQTEPLNNDATPESVRAFLRRFKERYKERHRKQDSTTTAVCAVVSDV